MLSEEDLQIAEERRKAKGKGQRKRYIQLNEESQKIRKRDRKALLFVFLSLFNLFLIEGFIELKAL